MGTPKSVAGRVDRHSYSEVFQEKRKPLTKAERRVIWDRLAKKYLRGKGLIGPKIPATWNWSLNEKVGGQVEGHCRSDARKAIKNILGISRDERLPIEVKIEKAKA
jgi:hypothetical protein